MPQGFAGGFLEGLTGGIDAARQRKLEAEERRTRHAREAVATIINSGQLGDISDIEPLLQIGYPDIYGEQAKKAKKGKNGQPAPHEVVNQFLTHSLAADRGELPMVHPDQVGGPTYPSFPGATPPYFPPNQGSAGGRPETNTPNSQVLPPMPGAATEQPAIAATPDRHFADTPDDMKAEPSPQDANAMFGLPGQEPLPSKPIAVPGQMPAPVAAAPAPAAAPPQVAAPPPQAPAARRSLFGVPLMTVEEAQQRDIRRGVSKTEQTLQAQMDLARRIYPAMKAVDPSITMRDVLTQITGHRSAIGAGMGMKPIAGTVDGQEVSAVFHPQYGYLDASTFQPLQNFMPHGMGHGGSGGTGFTGAVGQAVQTELAARQLTALPGPGPERNAIIDAAYKRINTAGLSKQEAQLNTINMQRFKAGLDPLTELPGATPAGTAPAAASPAAAGAGAAPGAEPTAQSGTAPSAAPAPSSAVASGLVTVDKEGKPTYNYDAAQKPEQFHGRVYDTLPQDMKDQVVRTAFYKTAPPTARTAGNTPRDVKLMNAVMEVNPSYSAQNFQNIGSALKAFTTGKQGDNLASLNMTLGHLETFAKKAEALNNTDIKLWNDIANKGLEHTGDPRVQGLLVAREALSNELTRLFRGTGGNEEEVKNWRAALNDSRSPEQFAEAVRTLDDLIMSRQKSLMNQWKTVQGAPAWDTMGFVSQDSKDAVARTDVIARRLSGQKPVGARSTPGGAKPGTTPQNKPGKATDTVPDTRIDPKTGDVYYKGQKVG